MQKDADGVYMRVTFAPLS